MLTISQIRKSAGAAAISIAALGAPATAAARFDLEPSAGVPPTAPASVRPAPAPRSPDAESGFQWGDAGIGAAGAVLLLGGGALVYAAPRRARRGARAV